MQAAKAELDALIRKLEMSVDDARTAKEIATIGRLIREANLRSTRIGTMILTAKTVDMASAQKAVAAAIPKIEGAIAEGEQLAKVARSVASALALVDKALDGASLLG